MALKALNPGGKMSRNHSVRFTSDDMPKYKSLESENSLPNYISQYQGPDSGAPSPDSYSFQPAAQRFRVNEQRIKLLNAINQIVQQRAELESNRITLSGLLDELRRKLKRRIEECHFEKKEKMKALKHANQRLEKEKFGLTTEIEHLKRHLEKEEAHHVKHVRTVVAQVLRHILMPYYLGDYNSLYDLAECVAQSRLDYVKQYFQKSLDCLTHTLMVLLVEQAIQGVVRNVPTDALFTPCSVADLPNVVCRNVAKNAPSRVADNKLAAARLMRDIAELRQRVAQVENRLANELKRKRQAELDIIRLRKELSTTKSCVASLRLPSQPLRKHCAKFA